MLPALVATRRRSPPYASSTPKTAPVRESKHPLDNELLKKPAQSGADGGAHGYLATPRFGARQQQIGHIDARNQQHETHRTQKHHHGGPDALNDSS